MQGPCTISPVEEIVSALTYYIACGKVLYGHVVVVDVVVVLVVVVVLLLLLLF